MNNFVEADLCVKCGLCLPHCPTYQQTLDENESPRGRIALIQGWSNGQLEASETLQKHLDQCLLCRACEKVCPAFVPYGKLMDQYRAEVCFSNKKSHKKLQDLLANRQKLRGFGWLLRFYKRAGISRLLQSTGVLKLAGLDRFDAMLPAITKSASKQIEKNGDQKEIFLFIGCMGRLLDEEVINSTKNLLSQLGYKVTIPEQQNCCGAIALHDGDHAVAKTLTEQNQQVFSETEIILTIASGCGATLLDSPSSLPDLPEIKAFSQKVTDISQFLLENWPDELLLKEFPKKVFIHTPCSLKNVMQQADAPAQLLAKVPGLELHKDSELQHCCGAAGRYMLDYPEMANSLADNLIDQIEVLNPDYLVSSNIGCAMHLRAAIASRGLKTKVMHPVVLLEKASL